ncbi:MAG: hypothetical protein J6T10_10510 [Methanobrevibacter sp.]|nr:hypothetical protein [Methanobrevibacter sp.]
MATKVYPLQEEINKDFQESAKLVQACMVGNNPLAQEIADKYFNAITRINDICVNRKRF